MPSIDQINQGGTIYEIVPEIAELFSTTKSYHTGDHVIYEAGWYTFKSDKTVGAWDATKVDGPFKVSDQLSDLKEDFTATEKYNDILSAVSSGKTNTLQLSKTEWSQGGLTNQGEETGALIRIRTPYIPLWGITSMSVSTVSGYEVRIHRFDENQSVMSTAFIDWTNSYEVNNISSLKYIRLVLKKTDGSNITTDDYNKCSVSFNADKNNLINVSDITDHIRLLPNGDVIAQTDTYTTGYIFVTSGKYYYCNSARAIINEYSSNNISSIIRQTVHRYPERIKLNDFTRYVRITSDRSTPKDSLVFALAESNSLSNDAVIGTMENLTAIWNMPESFGVANFIAMARHMTDIKWTPVAKMPVIHNFDSDTPKVITLQAGVTQTGMPYSSTRDVKKYVGSDVSFYTFMSALQNPRSVLYTRVITAGTLGATYYGCVCDQYASYCLGYKGPYIKSRELVKKCTKINLTAIKPGDLLISVQMDAETRENSEGHCVLITRVYKDKYGRIASVETSELINTFARKGNYSWSAFQAYVANGTGAVPFTPYRFNDIDGVQYTLNGFVKGYPDEELDEVSYPDIMPEYGDRATVEAGTDVTINIINARSYTTINVYKDNVLIDTKNTIADFTMTNMAYGTYKFEITDGSNSSYSTMIVADVHGTYDSESHIATFASANAIPYMAESYASNSTDPGQSGVQNKQHFFTTEEISNGTADLSDIVGAKYPYVRIMFINDYGAVKWNSYLLDDQWDYWEPSA